MPADVLFGFLAAAAALWEVYAAPKPGLVDRFSSGAHKDMDFDLFVTSARSLAPQWREQARVGLEAVPPEKALVRLRGNGLSMEKTMFSATGGINTHKGLIFILSLLLYGGGRCVALKTPPAAECLCHLASLPIRGCVAGELAPLRSSLPSRPLTHGEKLYLEHGVTGIRGEAEAGFPALLHHGLPALKDALQRGSSFNDAALHCLLHLMLVSEDSNVMHRKGFLFWMEEYKRIVLEVLEQGSVFTTEGRHGLRSLGERFSSEGISPGGAADLLAATVFLHWCEEIGSRFFE
ncbi:triphosphoribosyl-dephospho-CoA synthase [Aminiphilus sp.]|jgi:triphosphoribosyl-dephospho-CoA synthetase|uniref:triphosphoribosyl-dephospho-CoA synthase n=1 Tax=Aminiphilus sp. TaxID=1872488 RepID=UPI00262AC3FE|nr:triphosphoribosyl-dephospho-CoA synthase [Aminiphilus sp.]